MRLKGKEDLVPGLILRHQKAPSFIIKVLDQRFDPGFSKIEPSRFREYPITCKLITSIPDNLKKCYRCFEVGYFDLSYFSTIEDPETLKLSLINSDLKQGDECINTTFKTLKNSWIVDETGSILFGDLKDEI